MSARAAEQDDGGLLPPTGNYSAQYNPPTFPDPGGSASTEPRRQVSRSQGSNLGVFSQNCDLSESRIFLSFLGFLNTVVSLIWLPTWLSGKESTCNTGDTGSIPVLGRFSGEGNVYLFQYSCLGNPTDRGAWWAIVHGVAKQSEMT